MNAHGDRYDAVIVGARCAGAATAMLLARAGLSVLAIDRDPAGSDTLSTHALMRVGVSNVYDQLALAAARNWRFRPATMNGMPVKYRKAVQVTIKPTGPRD